MPSSRARTFLMIACLALAALIGALAWRATTNGRAPSGEGTAAVGGPFKMADQDGRSVDQSILKGRWSAVFFGYTACSDVCPISLQILAQAQARLGPKAKALRVVFVTVDPERDGPQQLKAYLSSPVFPKGTIGLTGSPAQVAAMARTYRITYQKVGAAGNYEVAHTTVIYLMDPSGTFARAIPFNLTPEQTANQIAQAMADGA